VNGRFVRHWDDCWRPGAGQGTRSVSQVKICSTGLSAVATALSHLLFSASMREVRKKRYRESDGVGVDGFGAHFRNRRFRSCMQSKQRSNILNSILLRTLPLYH